MTCLGVYRTEEDSLVDAIGREVFGARSTHDDHFRPAHDRDINRMLAPIDTASES